MEQYQYESAGLALINIKQWNSYLFDELKQAESTFDKKRIIEQIKQELKRNELPKGVIKNAVILLTDKYINNKSNEMRLSV